MEYDKIYNDDCMKHIKDIETASVDMIILDPNYNEWDDFCDRGLISESIRILKKTGNILCFTKQPFDFELRKAVHPFFRREFVWTFENGGAWVSKRMPLVSTQKIYWLTTSKEFYFNPRTGLKYNEKTREFKRKTKVFEGYHEEGHFFEKSQDGCWIRDHYHINKPHCGSIPAKPLELIGTFIHCLSKEGDVILDPFIGSGTTAIACIKEKRHFIGFELNKEYYDKANERIELELRQPTLF